MDISVFSGSFGHMFGVPNVVVDKYLCTATPEQLRVLLFLLRHNSETISSREVSTALQISEQNVDDAITFWLETKLFQNSASGTTAASHTETKVKSFQKNNFTQNDIVQAISSSEELQNLISTLETLKGNTLTQTEIRAILWMYDTNGISADAIAIVYQYCTGTLGKYSIPYMEKMLEKWWNDGFHQTSEIQKKIEEDKTFHSYTQQVKRICHMDALTEKMKKAIETWCARGASLPFVTYAYQTTLDRLSGKFNFNYMDKILISWCNSGFSTPEEVEKNQSKDNKKSVGKKSQNADIYESFINQV